MMPVQNFNAFNNSNKIRGTSNDRGSNSSSFNGSAGGSINQLEGLIVVENPIIISKEFNDEPHQV